MKALRDDVLCPTCGSALTARVPVHHELAGGEIEEFELGFTRGDQRRPCPRDPSFPSFSDYELRFDQADDGTWWCYAVDLTRAARSVCRAVRTRTVACGRGEVC